MLASQTIHDGTWWMPVWVENVLFCVAVGLFFVCVMWPLGSDVVKWCQERAKAKRDVRGFEVKLK